MTEPGEAVDHEAFRAGSSAAFRAAVERYSPRLLLTVRSFAPTEDAAHDLLQEVWVRAYRKRESFEGSGTLLGWLYSIARSVALSAADARATRERLLPEPALHMGAPPADPLASAAGSELEGAIRGALLELPDREREVVILRMLEGRSVRETAEVLGCAEGTVKATLHHALLKLKQAMEVWAR